MAADLLPDISRTVLNVTADMAVCHFRPIDLRKYNSGKRPLAYAVWSCNERARVSLRRPLRRCVHVGGSSHYQQEYGRRKQHSRAPDCGARQRPRYIGPQGREADITELLATSAQTGGKLGIFRQTIPPGSGPPTHLHQMEIEFVYVVSGQFKFKVADRVVSLPVGTFIFVPPNTAHTFKNIGTNPGVLIFGVTPGGFEKMFAERQGVNAHTNKGLMEKYHMQVVGPPLSVIPF